jgi:hypothetical protein
LADAVVLMQLLLVNGLRDLVPAYLSLGMVVEAVALPPHLDLHERARVRGVGGILLRVINRRYIAAAVDALLVLNHLSELLLGVQGRNDLGLYTLLLLLVEIQKLVVQLLDVGDPHVHLGFSIVLAYLKCEIPLSHVVVEGTDF